MKILKLKKNREFQRVYKSGVYFATKKLVIYILRNSCDKNYFGITVGKKVGKSVVRSRVTRLIREAIRQNAQGIIPGHDIVVLARSGAGDDNFKQIEGSLAYLIKKSGLSADGKA